MSDFDLYRLYKTLHVLAVVLLAGGIAIDTIVGPLMVRAKTIEQLRVYTQLSRISENFIILPAVLLVIGFGYATAGRADIDLSTTWLLIAQVLTYAAALAALGYLRTASINIDRLAREAPDGPIPDNVHRALKNPGPPVVGAALTVAFVFILYLMVAKPAW